jgi:hypothetical protein
MRTHFRISPGAFCSGFVPLLGPALHEVAALCSILLPHELPHELPQLLLPLLWQPVNVIPATRPAMLSAASATRILPLSTEFLLKEVWSERTGLPPAPMPPA